MFLNQLKEIIYFQSPVTFSWSNSSSPTSSLSSRSPRNWSHNQIFNIRDLLQKREENYI